MTPSNRRTLRLSVLEAMAYAAMVGVGEAYFLAYAIRLGATPLQQGLVIGLPLFAGSAGPLMALRVSRLLLGRRKPVVVAGAAGQCILLGVLAAVEALGSLTPATLIALVCLYQVCGQAAGTAWGSWFGDLVPSEVRGRFFARRTRATHVSTFVGLLAGGLLLHTLEPGRAAEGIAGSGPGFAVLFCVALAFRLVSVGLLAASPELRFKGPSPTARVLRYLATERGTAAWRFILIVAALQFVVYLASPYFNPYMLEGLGFSYLEYMSAVACIVLLKTGFLPLWGRLIDQFGPRSVGALAALLVAVVPLPWLWASGLGWVLVAQSLSGLAWGGFEVSQFTLLLETSYRRTRLQVFAAHSVLVGLAQLLGTLGGGLLIGVASGDPRPIFALSLAGRLLLTVWFPKLLPTLRGAPSIGRKDLLLRVIGIRPSGGLGHRPVDPHLPPGGE